MKSGKDSLISECTISYRLSKKSEKFDFEETVFTVNETRLLISEKIKKSFDPKRIFNPGKMYRGV